MKIKILGKKSWEGGGGKGRKGHGGNSTKINIFLQLPKYEHICMCFVVLCKNV